MWKAYGDTAAIYLPFGQTLYFLHDPSDVMEILRKQGKKFIKGRRLETFKLLIGHGVATSENKEWIQHRRAVQPSFHHRTLGSYTAAILQAAEHHRQQWLTSGPGFQDFNTMSSLLSLDIVARTLFGADLGSQLKQVHRAWDGAMEFILARACAPVSLPLGWPLPSHRRFRRSAEFIQNTVDQLIALQIEGRGSPDPNTFLARLLGSNSANPLTPADIRQQALNILFAGHETTASGLSSALYLILTQREVLQKFVAELQGVMGRASPDYATLEKQTYLRQVVYEALRLFPPVSIFIREALEEIELPTVILPKGATVMLSPYVIHRQRELWEDPERFEPERFDSQRRTEPPYFWAFGAGARTCAGDQFAINAMMLVLSDLFQNLDFELDLSRPVGLYFNGTLRPDPLRVRVIQRCEPRGRVAPAAPAAYASTVRSVTYR
jgi:cytochrome P450